MKKIKLIFHGLTGFWGNNRFIFALYSVGYIMICLMFIYVYTNYMPDIVRSAKNRAEDRFFALYQSSDEGNREALIAYLSSFEPEYCWFLTSVDVNELFGENYVAPSENMKTVTIMTQLNNQLPSSYYSGISCPYETAERLNNDEKIIIIPSNYKYESDVLMINGEEYDVVQGGAGGYAYISRSVFLENYEIGGIQVLIAQAMASDELINTIRIFKEQFGYETTMSPLNMDEIMNESAAQNKKIILIVFAMAVLVFAFLIKYILEQNKYEYTIYRLVGAEYDTVISHLLIQTGVWNLLLILTAIGTYKLLYYPVFNQINIYKNISMRFKDYVYMTSVLILLSAISVIPFIISSMRNTVRKSMNDYV